jgi:hypothetical protein
MAKDDIIRSSISLLKTPVFLSCLTTLIGFLSLQSHVLPPARELGVLVSFGIIVAFILSMTFLPAALKILPFLVHIQNAEKSGRFDKLLQLWGNYFARHNIGFLVVVGIIILIIATGIKQIKVDTNPIYFWDKNYEIRRSNDFIARFVNR